MNFEVVTEFEKKIAEFFGASHAVATDCATSAIELCLRYKNANHIVSPKRTYLSIPMLANKLGIELIWKDENWKNYYQVNSNIIDAAVYWKKNGYIKNTFMCLSFQYQKHLSIGRGGMILLDNEKDALQLKKMSYDGRWPHIPWREQNIDTIGFHYYMLPELAQIGLNKLQNAIDTEPKIWNISDWPDLTQMRVFKK